MANEIINSTSTSSKLNGLNSFRAEFEDGFEHFNLSLHCDELDVTQKTRNREFYKVKTFTARGRNGNVATFKIFVDK